MHNNRREFLDDFLSFKGEVGDDSARSVAARLLNRTVSAIWMKHEFREYRSPVPFQLTLTANQARYSLPDYFGRVGPGKIRNLTRHGTPLEPMRTGGQEERHPEQGTTYEVAAYPEEYDIVGVSGVHTQPASTGEALEVLSDNAADTDVKVSIAGDDNSGRWARNQVLLTGTVAVALGTWAFVDEFGKAYQSSSTPVTDLTSSRGTITLRKSATATELQKLFSDESAHEHPILLLYPKPSAADTLAIPVIRKPRRLLNDADTLPELWEGAIWEEMLIQWAVNSGDMSVAEAVRVPRPALIDLVAFDNEQRGPSKTLPFGMGI